MILIKELLPNPIGSDEEGEWIRIINDSIDQVNVAKLRVSDESGKIFSLNSVGSMDPGETVELSRSLTGIALNNNGDTVFLTDEKDQKLDELRYNSVSEGEIVTASGFALEPTQRSETALVEAGFGTIDYASGTVPVLVGATLALAAAIFTWFLVKNLFPTDEEEL